MKKFCPKCGKTIERGTFCEECNPNVFEFKQIKIKLCPTKKYFYKGKWTEFETLKEVTKTIVQKALNKKIKIIKGLEQYPDILEKTGLKKDFEIIIKEKQELIIPINIEITTSPSFSKVGSKYFEGILQVRGARDEIKKEIDQILEKQKIYINKKIEKKDKIDYYFVNKKYLSTVADELVSKHGAYKDLNAQLFSQDQQTSKGIYRVNAIVSIPPFKKDEVIQKEEKLLLITGTGKQINTHDLINNKKNSFKYNPEETHQYKKIPTQQTTIINTKPLTALSTQTYEVIELENPKNIEIKINQKVTIIEHKNKGYIIK